MCGWRRLCPKATRWIRSSKNRLNLGVKGVFSPAGPTLYCQIRHCKTERQNTPMAKISQEAAQQCGRGIVPVVGPFVTLASLFEHAPSDTRALMLYESDGRQGLRSILSQDFCGSWILIVGPEGGFAEAEAAFCQANGARLAGIGPRVLRTETAGLAALSAIMYECGDLGGM